MPFKPLRRNVLVRVGKAQARWKSDIIESPDAYKQIPSIGTIVSIGDGCKQFGLSDVNKKVLVGIVHDGDYRFSPSDTRSLGYEKKDGEWYLLCREDRISLFIE